MDWTAIGLTARLATWTTGVLFFLGMPLAYWLAATRWRGKFVVEAVVALPLVLPATVLGFYILMATGSYSPLGQAYESLTGTRLPFSFAGILLGSIVYNVPFAVAPFTAAFARVDRRLVEASWCLGESRCRTFLRVVLPLSWPGILAGVILTFAHTVGEFGVVLMVGGNIPGRTRTLSVSVFESVEALDYAAAHRSAALLLALSFAVLALVYGLQRRPFFRWTGR